MISARQVRFSWREKVGLLASDSTTPTADRANYVRALETTYIVNTNQGSQFTAKALVIEVKSRGSKRSMDDRGARRDNASAERLW